jgi:hypothetical protein
MRARVLVLVLVRSTQARTRSRKHTNTRVHARVRACVRELVRACGLRYGFAGFAPYIFDSVRVQKPDRRRRQ